jgi:F0F1-type ATP synthase membrane subunit c/vacuolar-type H+-ATPase subunit K
VAKNSETNTKKPRQAGEGIGIALGIGLCGLGAALGMPWYLDATPGWRVFWNAVGMVLGSVAVGGALTELEGEDRRGVSDVGVGLVIVGLAALVNYVVASTHLPTFIDTLLKWVVIIFIGVAAIGLSIGVGKFFAAAPARAEARREQSGKTGLLSKLLGAVTGIVGLGTAVVSLVQVLRAPHGG